MTNTEMRDALYSYCNDRKDCNANFEHPSCPLRDLILTGKSCYAECSDEELEVNYNMVFGEPVKFVNIGKPAEMVNHPDHYNHGSMECIDEMILIFGVEAVMDFCVCNAWKYRARAAYKGNPEEDMAKADWYLAKYKELEEKDNVNYKLP